MSDDTSSPKLCLPATETSIFMAKNIIVKWLEHFKQCLSVWPGPSVCKAQYSELSPWPGLCLELSCLWSHVSDLRLPICHCCWFLHEGKEGELQVKVEGMGSVGERERERAKIQEVTLRATEKNQLLNKASSLSQTSDHYGLSAW